MGLGEASAYLQMTIRFSITFKLLLFILPLVFLPIAIVGYLSYHASVERVSRLSRAEQMLQAKMVAAKINGIFESCCMDLETVSYLPAIEDYYFATINGLKAETKDSQKKILKIFKDFVERSPYYCQIRFFDKDGRELVGASALGRGGQHSSQQSKISLKQDRYANGAPLHISGISPSPSRQGFVIYFAKPFINIQKEFVGEVVIDLDYDKVIDLVKEVRVGAQGFAFMVDQLGRTIAHPKFRPYEYDLSKYPDPRLREFVIDMMAGETGWKRYYYLGEKAAAYAPVPVMNWSLAVSIPIEEFKQEAEAIRSRVIQVVVAMLFLVGLVIAVLSYNLLRPVRRLVAATERIASGDLSQEIPVKSRDELGTLTRSFNSMIVNLRDTQNELVRSEKLVALGRLSAGVAHEIRNPLNAMKGAIVHLKRRRSDDPLLKEYTEIILEEISRLNQFATEFLYFARQSAPKFMPTDLNELIHNALTLFQERFKEKGIKAVKHFDTYLPVIRIDPHQMEQVVVNLLINAMDAMPEGGRLELSTAVEENGRGMDPPQKVLITIRDDGVGIPQKDIQSIFDPFFSTKETGTGLGLPISQGIVESHDGLLRIKSKEDEGTTVIIELPIHEAHVAEEIKDEKKDPDR